MLLETILAIDRPVILRLKGNLSLLTAVSTYDLIHLAGRTAITSAAALIAAIAATSRLVLKSFLSIKFLFTCTEDELLATFLAL